MALSDVLWCLHKPIVCYFVVLLAVPGGKSCWLDRLCRYLKIRNCLRLQIISSVGKRWLSFGDSFCTWVDEEILLAGFVIWILEIIIKIKIRVLCEKIHKTSIIFQVIDSGSLIRIVLLVFVVFETGSEETIGWTESEIRADHL